MPSALKQLAIGEAYSSNRDGFLLVRLQAAEDCANVLVCHAYLNDTLVASASTSEAFVEGYSNHHATMTVPVPRGSTVRIERDRISGDAGSVTITVVEF
ncbi:MAG: hypothetical protein ACK5OB_12655 [Pirellula sp.]